MPALHHALHSCQLLHILHETIKLIFKRRHTVLKKIRNIADIKLYFYIKTFLWLKAFRLAPSNSSSNSQLSGRKASVISVATKHPNRKQTSVSFEIIAIQCLSQLTKFKYANVSRQKINSSVG